MSQPECMMLFVVLATGDRGRHVARVAQEQAEYDVEHRRVVKPGDPMYPTPVQIAAWAIGTAAALILDERGTLRVVLDEQRAISGPWVEDAFVRASHDSK